MFDHISVEKLGFFRLNGKRFVIHGGPGCPRNACIEVVNGDLRCWACHRPVDQKATSHLRRNFKLTESGTFLDTKRSISPRMERF